MIELLYKAGGLIAAIYAIYRVYRRFIKPLLSWLYWDFFKGVLFETCLRLNCMWVHNFMGELDGYNKSYRLQFNEPNYPYPEDHPKAKYQWVEEVQRWVLKSQVEYCLKRFYEPKCKMQILEETCHYDPKLNKWVPNDPTH